ncbi:MAG: UDP-2,4-diacetamido-2,4,6-trideoxy-beta-L-altropyranose hydrolase [Bacteroidota bacterium]
MKQRIILRADGNAKMGLGHIYRCLTIVEMLKEDFSCVFITRLPVPALLHRMKQLCSQTIVLPDDLTESAELQYLQQNLRLSDILVLDGYHFQTDYQEALKKRAGQLVCIDDIFATRFVADVILNPCGGVQAQQYDAASSTRFCLGPDYALLHPVFQAAAQQAIAERRTNQVLICLGGADPHNVSLSVLQRCEAVGTFSMGHIITGAAYHHQASLDAYLQQSKWPVVQHRHLSPAQMVAVMQQCATAICAASGIASEYLSVGGTLYLLQTADNQAAIFRYFIEQQLAFPFAEFPVAAVSQLEQAKARQRQIFRGQSAQNIVQLFKTLRHAIPQSTC